MWILLCHLLENHLNRSIFIACVSLRVVDPVTFEMSSVFKTVTFILVLVFQGTAAWSPAFKRFFVKSVALVASTGIMVGVAHAELTPAPWDKTGELKFLLKFVKYYLSIVDSIVLSTLKLVVL